MNHFLTIFLSSFLFTANIAWAQEYIWGESDQNYVDKKLKEGKNVNQRDDRQDIYDVFNYLREKGIVKIKNNEVYDRLMAWQDDLLQVRSQDYACKLLNSEKGSLIKYQQSPAVRKKFAKITGRTPEELLEQEGKFQKGSIPFDPTLVEDSYLPGFHLKVEKLKLSRVNLDLEIKSSDIEEAIGDILPQLDDTELERVENLFVNHLPNVIEQINNSNLEDIKPDANIEKDNEFKGTFYSELSKFQQISNDNYQIGITNLFLNTTENYERLTVKSQKRTSGKNSPQKKSSQSGSVKCFAKWGNSSKKPNVKTTRTKIYATTQETNTRTQQIENLDNYDCIETNAYNLKRDIIELVKQKKNNNTSIQNYKTLQKDIHARIELVQNFVDKLDEFLILKKRIVDANSDQDTFSNAQKAKEFQEGWYPIYSKLKNELKGYCDNYHALIGKIKIMLWADEKNYSWDPEVIRQVEAKGQSVEKLNQLVESTVTKLKTRMSLTAQERIKELETKYNEVLVSIEKGNIWSIILSSDIAKKMGDGKIKTKMQMLKLLEDPSIRAMVIDQINQLLSTKSSIKNEIEKLHNRNEAIEIELKTIGTNPKYSNC